MAWNGRSPLVVIGVSLIVCRTGPALAACAPDYADLVPWDGSTGVGTDVRPIWMEPWAMETPTLTLTETASGAAVPADVVWEQTSGTTGYGWITPREPLEPFTAYTVTDGELVRGFETGEGPTSSIPEIPVITGSRSWARGESIEDPSCDGSAYWVEGVTPSASVYLTVDELADDAGVVQARVTLDTGVERLVLGTRDDVAAGAYGCTSNMLEMSDARLVTISLRTVGFSGSVSDWSEPVKIALPWLAECPDVAEQAATGCATAPSQGLGLMALVLALVAAWSRRSRPGRA